jgi:hypothetical protein
VAVHQALFIVTLDPQAFSEKELALLTREAVLIGEKDEPLMMSRSPGEMA